MSKLKCEEFTFLNNIALQVENGENLERAFFLVEDVPEEILLRLQLGEELTEVITSIDFSYPALTNLLTSIDHTDESETLERIKTTAKLIRLREEILKEKNTIQKIHKRRIKIIRYVTLITIAIIAGFSPIFANLYEFIKTGEFTSSFSIWSMMSISFLIINILNNYYLLKLSDEKKIKFKLLPVVLLHIATVIGIRVFLLNLIPF